MASRTSAPARPRSAGSGSKGGARPAASRPTSRKAPRRGATSRRSPARTKPSAAVTFLRAVGRLLAALLRGVVGLVTAAAHALGSASRAVGSGARDLDPAHRRDGLGLLLLALAVVAAGGAWWHAGRAGESVDEALTAVFGKGALLLPLLLALGAWRVLRHPDGKGGRGRLAIGWLALALGVLGIVHVLKGAGPG
jgi:S-DNA-T family DNA segregation ATPase FtsK/SpoIIIE